MNENTTDEQLQIPEELPVLPIRDLVIFPDMIAPLVASRSTSQSAVEAALDDSRMVMLVTQRNTETAEPGPEDVFQVGTVGIVVRVKKEEDGRLKLMVQGLRKARVGSFTQDHPHMVANIKPILDLPLDEISTETQALMRSALEQVLSYSRIQGTPAAGVIATMENTSDPGRLADLIVSHLPLAPSDAQKVLETPDPIRRLRAVVEHQAKELELLSAKEHIERQVREGLDKSQREYYLRQQLKEIRSELGDEAEDDIEELEQRLAASAMDEQARKEANKQIKRLAKMHAESSEASTLRTYLEQLLDMPWGKKSEDQLDLARAQKILDEDHLGMDEVKDRLLEHLAVRKLNPSSPAPIMCLIGPPGVGKTSLGKSIARALGRKFVRVSLGGVRDEAEIRGHRRTYVGAMPGRIIQAITQAGTMNPLIALDEIDKVGRDLRGDPTAALLEVLDPEQNNAFVDHYLNVPFDLSSVLFFATGNRTDTIPPALLDRMELIPVSGYDLEQKASIAAHYLLPRQISKCGLKPEQLEMDEIVLQQLVENYTRESGVRQLEQTIGRLARKIARQVAQKGEVSDKLTSQRIRRMLGPPIFHSLPALETDSVGIANGLAWTPAGGEVLQLEATSMRGRGRLILTGQLGDVMQESAQTALSYTKSLDARKSEDSGPFAGQDIHIHIPAGAIPKDGPSAGVAMAVVLVSLLTRIPVRSDLAMTGEISLRGRLLPVGGLREKILAALRAGLNQVIVPARNADQVQELPKDLKNRIEVLLAESVEQALDWALVSSPFAPDHRGWTRSENNEQGITENPGTLLGGGA